MRGLRFLDFDLTFQRVEKGYLAKVLGSPAGQASLEFTLPFSEIEIENFLLRFGRSRQPTRRLGVAQIDSAKAFGGRLFEAAFQGEVRSCLRSSLDEAQRLDLGLRLRLRLNDTPELNDLPWEFLLYPALGRFLALSTETPLVRYIDLPERVRPLAVKPPLEILAVISSPEDYPPLDVEEEWRQLQVSLADLQGRGLLRLSRLDSPTLPDLQRFLRRETCHILHFIGHGCFDLRTEDGLLLFTDGKGRGREVGGAALGTLLHDHRPLRLAVLNACEGARASRTDPFAGVAQALVREGIPAVVAMQFEISDLAAIELAHELYSAIVDGYPIDAALGEARKALYFAGHELAWGTPVLYMRSPDGQLFDLDGAVPVAGTEREEARSGSESIKEATPPAGAVAGAEAWERAPVEDEPAEAPREAVGLPGPPPMAMALEAWPVEEILPEAPLIEPTPVEAAAIGPAAAGSEAIEPDRMEPAPVELVAAESLRVEIKARPEAARVPEQEPSFEGPPAAPAGFGAAPVVRDEPPPQPVFEPSITEFPGASGRRADETPTPSPKAHSGPNRPRWLVIGGVLGFALVMVALVATLLHLGRKLVGGEDEVPPKQALEKSRKQRISSPSPVQPGVYLAAAVQKGEAIRSSHLRIETPEAIPGGEPKGYSDLKTGCFERDLVPPHRLTWSDVGKCR